LRGITDYLIRTDVTAKEKEFCTVQKYLLQCLADILQQRLETP
jgi:hypothetical protein